MTCDCEKCGNGFSVAPGPGHERLWRRVCPHCNHTVWISAPVVEAAPREVPRILRSSRWPRSSVVN